MELTSHQVAVIAVNTVFPFVSLIFVILRFYARLVTRITPRTNDYLIIVAFVNTSALFLVILTLRFHSFACSGSPFLSSTVFNKVPLSC